MNDTNSAGLDRFIGKLTSEIVNPIITLLALAAFVLFAWGFLEFMLGAGDEEKRRTGRTHMLWGIIGLVIVFGAQIIVRILRNIVT